MIKLSIIVPIYNVEQYLRKCVDSLLQQDYDNYEIILVDDGSTDKSQNVLDENGWHYRHVDDKKATYSQPKVECVETKHSHEALPHIVLVSQTKKGPGAARNAGMRVAKGKYILFVDSDDYLEPNVLGCLVQRMEQDQLDVLRFNYQLVHINTMGQYEVFWPFKRKRLMDSDTSIVDGATYLDARMDNGCFVWQFMISRDVIVGDESVLFVEGMYYEDVEWMPRMMLRAKRVSATDMMVYNYLQREGSITKTLDQEILQQEADTMLRLIQSIHGHRQHSKAVSWCKRMITELTLHLYELLATRFWNERKIYIQKLKESNAHCLSTEGLNIRKYCRTILHNINPTFYCYLLHYYRKK